jgi:hypothetical protein
VPPTRLRRHRLPPSRFRRRAGRPRLLNVPTRGGRCRQPDDLSSRPTTCRLPCGGMPRLRFAGPSTGVHIMRGIRHLPKRGYALTTGPLGRHCRPMGRPRWPMRGHRWRPWFFAPSAFCCGTRGQCFFPAWPQTSQDHPT